MVVIWGIIAVVIVAFIVYAVMSKSVALPGRLRQSEKDDE